MAGESKGATHVMVACKIPNGLLLRNFRQEQFDVPVMGGGVHTETRSIPVGPMVKINGPAAPYGKAPEGPIAGGYAFTRVNAQFWAEWLRANKEHDAVLNHLIFAHEDPDSVKARAIDRKDTLSGLQPIMPDKDKRLKTNNPNLVVEAAEAPEAA